MSEGETVEYPGELLEANLYVDNDPDHIIITVRLPATAVISRFVTVAFGLGVGRQARSDKAPPEGNAPTPETLRSQPPPPRPNPINERGQVVFPTPRSGRPS